MAANTEGGKRRGRMARSLVVRLASTGYSYSGRVASLITGSALTATHNLLKIGPVP